MRRAIARVEAQIESAIAAMTAGGTYTKDLGSHIAWLNAQLVPLLGEQRQQAKAALRDVSKIPLETVIEHLKTLPPNKREDIAREITGADAEEPLL